MLAILEIMKLKNAKLFISGKNIIKNETKRVEKFMKTKYAIFPKPNLSNKSDFQFKIPPPNQFIPEKFEIS